MTALVGMKPVVAQFLPEQFPRRVDRAPDHEVPNGGVRDQLEIVLPGELPIQPGVGIGHEPAGDLEQDHFGPDRPRLENQPFEILLRLRPVPFLEEILAAQLDHDDLGIPLENLGDFLQALLGIDPSRRPIEDRDPDLLPQNERIPEDGQAVADAHDRAVRQERRPAGRVLHRPPVPRHADPRDREEGQSDRREPFRRQGLAAAQKEVARSDADHDEPQDDQPRRPVDALDEDDPHANRQGTPRRPPPQHPHRGGNQPEEDHPGQGRRKHQEREDQPHVRDDFSCDPAETTPPPGLLLRLVHVRALS